MPDEQVRTIKALEKVYSDFDVDMSARLFITAFYNLSLQTMIFFRFYSSNFSAGFGGLLSV